ncbi:hypothetical protein J3L18_29615 [Mucilaginibacter gossypii]|uniref:hypothetical protein n=1 Tax=Mucilaginibacter gossypii TaxID=551996 RepID=UPI000DCB590B|nr:MULTISPECIES: hypothetical protein [Mucilaginibacter]QTE37216.1 hypothetical protein J3L18_29615 [Mucilaginibacter gossypii]RAV57178.1 hypothetical protein DIU36_12700 [Mucilaginibacter rubeus]
MSIYIDFDTIEQELVNYFSDFFDTMRFALSPRKDGLTMTGFRDGKQYQYTFGQQEFDYEYNTSRLHHYLENVKGSWHIKY